MTEIDEWSKGKSTWRRTYEWVYFLKVVYEKFMNETHEC